MATLLHIRPMVLLPLRDRTAVAEHTIQEGSADIFVPGYTHLASGTGVELEIVFAREQLSIYTRGVVRWKRASGTRRLPAGIGVELTKADQRTRSLLSDFAAGRGVRLVKRVARRFPVEIDVDYATASDPGLCGVTRDLSRSGAAIIGSRAPAVGTQLRLHMRSSHELADLVIGAEVRWWRVADSSLFGVRFLLDNRKIARRVERLIDEVKQQIAEDHSGRK